MIPTAVLDRYKIIAAWLPSPDRGEISHARILALTTLALAWCTVIGEEATALLSRIEDAIDSSTGSLDNIEDALGARK